MDPTERSEGGQITKERDARREGRNPEGITPRSVERSETKQVVLTEGVASTEERSDEG